MEPVASDFTKNFSAKPRSAQLLLIREYKDLITNPVPGFTVSLDDDQNLFRWNINVFGPPDTPYWGGYFKAVMFFGDDYPFKPPIFQFITPILHPNIYSNGKVCISILHASGDDPVGVESASERWLPVQGVRSVVLSIISLLGNPNPTNPVTVEIGKLFDTRYDEYVKVIEKQVNASALIAAKENVKIPTTKDEYLSIETYRIQPSSVEIKDEGPRSE